MTKVIDVVHWMEMMAPLRLSAEWDNTGLLLGDLQRDVQRVMTCLTLTEESAEEAVARQAELVITHHPLPFRPLKRITTEDTTGKLLWTLATAGISIYCPHTAWDSAAHGINAQIANKLGLSSVMPLISEPLSGHLSDTSSGLGRVGVLTQAQELRSIAVNLARAVPHCRPRVVDCGKAIRKVGIVCGSGGSLLESAVRSECDLFVSGEATFHQCLEAKAAGVSMLLIGHFASEKFAMDHLAEVCRSEFPDLEVWGSLNEKDPVSSI